jgi:hypothetical protein
VTHPQDRGSLGHLAASDFLEPEFVDRSLSASVQDIAALATGASDHHDLDTLIDVHGGRGRTLARLIVRVRMHGHQAKI